jgi:hypothetical protein
MEPDTAPIDEQFDTGLADVFPIEFSPAQLAAMTAADLGLVVLPLLILLTAALKLRRWPEHRTLHIGLALAAGLAVVLAALTTFAPRAIPDIARDTGILSFTWVFLFAWMAIDFSRSARRTGLRPRASDIAVLLCAAAVVLALLSPVLIF